MINIVAKILELTLFSVISWPLMPSPRSSSSRRSSTPEMADEQDWEGSRYFSIISTTYYILKTEDYTEYWKSKDFQCICTVFDVHCCIHLRWSCFYYLDNWSNDHLSKGVGFWARSCEAWGVRHRILKKKNWSLIFFCETFVWIFVTQSQSYSMC